MMQKIGIVGVGNMGLAIIQGALYSKVFTPKDFLAYSKNVNRQKLVEKMTGVNFATTFKEIASCETIIIATKPQDISAVATSLEEYITDNNLIVSIAAGITLKTLQQQLKGKGHIVRVMPNTPIAICQGVSAIAVDESCVEKDIAMAQKLFSALGMSFIVKEEMFDTISALSGSGPAYFYYFIESIIKAAIEEGLKKKLAYDLILSTFSGVMQLLKSSSLDISMLRKMVTSPKGSTIEAINIFEKNNFSEIIQEGIRAAIFRNKEMVKARKSSRKICFFSKRNKKK